MDAETENALRRLELVPLGLDRGGIVDRVAQIARDEIRRLDAQRDLARAERDTMTAALQLAIKVADEARDEWDAAPQGMRAGKIIIALSGALPGYRTDIDAIHAALRRREVK